MSTRSIRDPRSVGIDRRTFLAACGLGAVSLAAAGCGSGGRPTREWAPISPLRMPPELRLAEGTELVVGAGTTEILPGTRTPTWGVNGPHLGPTLRVRTGDRVRPVVRNTLDEVTTLHWHGMLLPARADGGPHQPIPPGHRWEPGWTVTNPASTLWYHPHTHGETARQVFNGVAGLVLVDDDHSDRLDLPRDYGVDDIPCVLQDRTITDSGEMPFDTEPNFGQMGTDVLVNGTLGAHVELTRTTLRLRFLNGSNARLYRLAFADDREFALVATDQGLLPESIPLRLLELGPAERAEIVVRLTPGERVLLRTLDGDERISEGDLSILELRVAPDAAPGVEPPRELGGRRPVPPPEGARVRTFDLEGHDRINGRGMDMARVDEVVPAGAVEVWEIRNTVYAHNFHIHGCAFTVLDRDGAPPATWEAGWKDTVHLPEKSTVRLGVHHDRYTDPTSPYMYHCHILRHEDAGMMGQFVVVEPGTEATTPRVLAGGGHGGGH